MSSLRNNHNQQQQQQQQQQRQQGSIDSKNFAILLPLVSAWECVLRNLIRGTFYGPGRTLLSLPVASCNRSSFRYITSASGMRLLVEEFLLSRYLFYCEVANSLASVHFTHSIAEVQTEIELRHIGSATFANSKSQIFAHRFK